MLYGTIWHLLALKYGELNMSNYMPPAPLWFECLAWICCCPCMCKETCDERAKSRPKRLLEAADRGNWLEVQRLYAMHAVDTRDAEQNWQNYDGDTILMKAARSGQVAVISTIFNQDGARRVNLRDRRGATALIHAARSGQIAAMKLLFEKNADLNISDLFHKTAAFSAAEKEQTVALELLLAKGADFFSEMDRKERPDNYQLVLQNVKVIGSLKNHMKSVVAQILTVKGLNRDVASVIASYLNPTGQVVEVDKADEEAAKKEDSEQLSEGELVTVRRDQHSGLTDEEPVALVIHKSEIQPG